MGVENKRGIENIAWRLAQVEAMLNRSPSRKLVADLLQREPGYGGLEFNQAQMRAEIFLNIGKGIVGAREFFEVFSERGQLDPKVAELLEGLHLLYAGDRNGNGEVEMGRAVGTMRMPEVTILKNEYSDGLRWASARARERLREKVRMAGWDFNKYRMALVGFEDVEHINMEYVEFTAIFTILSRKPEVIGEDGLIWLHNTLVDQKQLHTFP